MTHFGAFFTVEWEGYQGVQPVCCYIRTGWVH